MRQYASGIADYLIALFELSNTVPELKRRIFTIMALLGIFLLGTDIILALSLDFDWFTFSLNVVAILFAVAMIWLLWQQRARQELILLILFFGLTIYLLLMMSYHTGRLSPEIFRASLSRALAPWFVWFMLLNIGCFFTFRARTALRVSLIITTLLLLIVTIMIVKRLPFPLIAIRDLILLALSNVLLIALAFPMAMTQERNSQIDFLTGIANRMRGYEALAKEIERAERYNTIFAIILIDLDYFKKINDTHGHLSGDAVLRELALFIGNRIRKTDILCRWGGEEFLLVLPQSDLTSGRLKADYLRHQIKNRSFYKKIPITASFGVTAFYPRDSTATILERVDAALYRAKANGRNCVETE